MGVCSGVSAPNVVPPYVKGCGYLFFFFSSRRRHTRCSRDWSSDVCSSDLLPKAARWLVKNRRNGYYWLSTKETAFAIYGLTDYLKVSKELSPDYSFEIYLNEIGRASCRERV